MSKRRHGYSKSKRRYKKKPTSQEDKAFKAKAEAWQEYSESFIKGRVLKKDLAFLICYSDVSILKKLEREIEIVASSREGLQIISEAIIKLTVRGRNFLPTLEFIFKTVSAESAKLLANSKCTDNTTLLHLAARRGSGDAVKLLLKNGAEIIQDNYRNTPLHIAANSMNAESLWPILQKASKEQIMLKGKEEESFLHTLANTMQVRAYNQAINICNEKDIDIDELKNCHHRSHSPDTTINMYRKFETQMVKRFRNDRHKIIEKTIANTENYYEYQVGKCFELFYDILTKGRKITSTEPPKLRTILIDTLQLLSKLYSENHPKKLHIQNTAAVLFEFYDYSVVIYAENSGARTEKQLARIATCLELPSAAIPIYLRLCEYSMQIGKDTQAVS